MVGHLNLILKIRSAHFKLNLSSNSILYATKNIFEICYFVFIYVPNKITFFMMANVSRWLKT